MGTGVGDLGGREGSTDIVVGSVGIIDDDLAGRGNAREDDEVTAAGEAARALGADHIFALFQLSDHAVDL